MIPLAPLGASTYIDTDFASWTTLLGAAYGPNLSAIAVNGTRQESMGNAIYASNQTYGPGPSAGVVAVHLSGITYTPSVNGTLTSVTTAVDLNMTSWGNSYAVAYFPALSQGGRHYIGNTAYTDISLGDWYSWSPPTLGAADYFELNPNGTTNSLSNPDFSPLGGIITFGLMTSNGTNLGNATSTSSEFDDYSVTLTSIPEPSHVAFALGALALAWVGRRRVLSA